MTKVLVEQPKLHRGIKDYDVLTKKVYINWARFHSNVYLNPNDEFMFLSQLLATLIYTLLKKIGLPYLGCGKVINFICTGALCDL